MVMNTISARELHELHESGEKVDLIDVRTPVEYRESHIAFALNTPLDSLDPQAVMAARNGSAGQPLYVICRTGSRGEKACHKLVDCGFDNIVNVSGGVAEWGAGGLPLVRGKKAVSLERQVRIAAGLIVLVGTVLGFWVHPLFLIIPGFVGAGLAFAGITDTCAMGMLLAKMPWNQVRCEVGDKTKGKTGCCA